jgi:ABC-type uncharacterized transport system permease subunit
MASLAELYPNPEYERVLQKAIDNKSLLPMEALCPAFPREASGAFLSYAQSASFVRFIHQNYGTSGLKNLMLHYQDGLGCSEGAQAALGSSLQQLENRWHMEALKINVQVLALQNLAPYILILLLVTVPPAAAALFTRKKAVKS